MTHYYPYHPPLPQPAALIRVDTCDSRSHTFRETRTATAHHLRGRRWLHTSATAHWTQFTAYWTYTFSAKEKDVETGLSYFGSRYYGSDLSIWLSVDPMSDKYASLSPYVYCADNPVKLVDPNGEDWFENELTGDVYYSRDYRKGDEKELKGEGWKWMGENNMFGQSADDAITANLDKADVYAQDDSYDRVGFSGNNAKIFMSNMGYKSVPTQVVSYEDVYQNSISANPYQHIKISNGLVIDYTEKVGYVPSNYIEKCRTTVNTIYGKYDPIKNNMKSVSRVTISYQRSRIPSEISSLLHAMNGRQDYINRIQTSISNYKGNIPLVNTFLKQFPK